MEDSDQSPFPKLDRDEWNRRETLTAQEAFAEVEAKIDQARSSSATELDFRGYPIDRLPDLTELKELRALTFANTEINDITFLASLFNLQFLEFWSTQVSDLAPLAALTNLRSIDFSGTQVDDLAPLAGLTCLQLIDLSDTQVDDLAPLAGLARLQSINCSGTKVSELAPLASLICLTSINCLGTQVSDLVPLSGLTCLQSIDCSGTPVGDLVPLSALTYLQSIAFAGSQVSELAPLANLANLKSLYFSRTPVKNLTPLAGLHHLESIDCSYMSIDNISGLAHLANLKSIDLSGTDVSDLSPLAKLSHLQRLYCFGTKVVEIYPLVGLVNLELVACAYTLVKDLTPLAGLPNLRSISFAGTATSDLTPLTGLTGLEFLDCSATEVADLGPLAGLANLQMLNHSHTKVIDLTPLQNLPNLESITCSNTEISNLRPLASLPNLASIVCSHTLVSDLSVLAGIAALRMIDFEGTEVTDLSPLALIPTLRKFDCSGNQIAFWPRSLLLLDHPLEVVAKGTKILSIPPEELSENYGDDCLPRLKSYFEDLGEDSTRLDRVKIIILGNGRVGKTQLKRWLLNSADRPLPYDPAIRSTHGIEVMRGQIAVPAASGDTTSLDASIWDFGGQDIYHGTHSLFLRTRAIFVVAWCPEQEGTPEQELDGLVHHNEPLAYWLDFIRQYAGSDNPVLVVQSQCDRLGMEQPSRHPPREDGSPTKFLQFSALTDYGGAGLREALGHAASWIEQNHGVPALGKARRQVLDRLEAWRDENAALPAEQRRRWLSQHEFAALCAEAGGVSSIEHFLRFLHNTGTVFYREGLFDDRIILDQDWALGAIYTAFDRDHCYHVLKASRGRFTPRTIGSIAWQGYEANERALFISMMESCGIAFRHSGEPGDDGSEYIAPEFLPDHADTAAEDRWNVVGEVREARLPFDLLHHGLMFQILAAIGRQAGFKAEYWKHGVLFNEGNTRSLARIEAKRDIGKWSGEITIACRSGNADELLDRLVAKVVEIAQHHGIQAQVIRNETQSPAIAVKDVLPAQDAGLDIGLPPSNGNNWYVSYAWGDTTPEGIERAAKVDDLCAQAENRGIRIIRDRDKMQNGDSIRSFMHQLVQGDRIIAIVSDKYLHSAPCMFELHSSFLAQKSDPDLFVKAVRAYQTPCAQIGKIGRRIEIAKYWSDWVKNHENDLKYMGQHDQQDWRLANQYALGVGDILYAINDHIQPRQWDEFLEWAFAP